jgi:hypothetical protein
MWSNVCNPIWQINFKVSKGRMSYLGLHQVMCWLHFILIKAHFQSCDILFIWIHLVWIITNSQHKLRTFVDTTLTLTLHNLSVQNSFPSLLANCCQSLALPITLGCTPGTLASFQVLDSLALSVIVVIRAFLFTKDTLNCTNMFASIDIFKPNSISSCALAL